MLELKEYQRQACDEIEEASIELIENPGLSINGCKQLLLVAPTGAGKTVMGSTIIKELKEKLGMSGFSVAFIWMSIGKGQLHLQSKASLERNTEGVNFYSKEDIESGVVRQLDHGDTLVLSWDQITMKNKQTKEWSNTIMREDSANNLQSVVSETMANNTKVILIIDESHASTDTERGVEVRGIMNPTLQIGITATPKDNQLRSASKVVEIKTEDVIEEGMIKKTVEINKGIHAVKDDMLGILLGAALRQKDRLAKGYKKCGVDINPLILIQLPNSQQGDVIYTEVQKFLASKEITVENKRLAVWLTNEKQNLEDLANLQGIQDVLVFKSAIDTGWDCPRAQILVKFRDMKSETFKKQIVGRILRMPEQKHYSREELNSAYIYTDEDQFRLDDQSIIEKMNVLKAGSSIKEEFRDLCDILSLPTYTIPKKLKAQLDISNVLYEFLNIFKSQEDAFWDRARSSEGLSQAALMVDGSVKTNHMTLVETGETKKLIVEMASPMLKSIVYKHVKLAIKNTQYAKVVFDSLISMKQKGIKAKEYYKMLACNATTIQAILNQLVNSNFRYPDVYESDISLDWFNMQDSISLDESKIINLEPWEHKCVYEHYAKTNYKPLQALINATNQDDSIQFWYPNYLFNSKPEYQVRIPNFNSTEFNFIIPHIITRDKSGVMSFIYITQNTEDYSEAESALNAYITGLNMPKLVYRCVSSDILYEQLQQKDNVDEFDMQAVRGIDDLEYQSSVYQDYRLSEAEETVNVTPLDVQESEDEFNIGTIGIGGSAPVFGTSTPPPTIPQI